MDESTVNWSKERFDEIKKSMTPFLKQVCSMNCICKLTIATTVAGLQTGYNPKTDVHWIPVSGYSGANIRDPVEQAQCDWYQGPTLLQCLDDLKSLDRDRKYLQAWSRNSTILSVCLCLTSSVWPTSHSMPRQVPLSWHNGFVWKSRERDSIQRAEGTCQRLSIWGVSAEH